jgi:uncharacterized protein
VAKEGMSAGHRVLSAHEYEATANGLCAVAIMTKAPQAGKVKTRLTPPLTAEEAAALNTCFLRDSAAAIADAGAGVRGIGCYTPVDAGGAYQEIFPSDFLLIAQRGSDLRERLVFAVQDLLAVGFSSVCLIGSDSPTIPSSTFTEAVKVLSRPDDCVVLGPSDDGGYYLVGLKKMHRRIFEEISWSTKSVMKQTLVRAAEIGLPVHLLPAGYDVDDRLTLRRLYHDLLDPNVRGAEIAAPATRTFLRQLLAGGARGLI